MMEQQRWPALDVARVATFNCGGLPSKGPPKLQLHKIDACTPPYAVQLPAEQCHGIGGPALCLAAALLGTISSVPKCRPNARHRSIRKGQWKRHMHNKRSIARMAAGPPGRLFEIAPNSLLGEKEALVVWLHGFGDTGQAWSETAPALQRMGMPNLRFVIPTAPIRDTGVGSRGPTTSWYDVLSLDPDAIQQQHGPPDGLEDNVQYILDLVEPHVRRGVHPSRVFLVGFSQGGGLALAAALRAPRPLGGVLMLSSWIAEPMPAQIPISTPVHLFHGAGDAVVPANAAQVCQAVLSSAGLQASLRIYEEMANGVCDREVGDIAQTLYEALR